MTALFGRGGRVSPLTLDELRIEGREGGAIASMRVDGAERLELRRHGAGTDLIADDGTPFVALAALLAAAGGRDVRVDAPVDARALENARAMGSLLSRWFGWRAPRIECGPAAAPRAPAPGVGLFFSRGLDSMTTLIEQRERITALIGMDWRDPPYATEGTAEIWASTRAAADELGLPLIHVSSNARTFLDPVLAWELCHGVLLGAFAQLAAPSIGEALVSGTHPAGEERVYGSHPLLDPLWSSSRVQVVYVPGPGGRSEKAALVARDRFALRRLKVCWERDGDGNCGRCAKCLMTLTNFHIAGALEAAAPCFDAPLSPEAVRACAPTAQLGPENAGSLLRRLDPGDPLYEPWTLVLERVKSHSPVLAAQRDLST